MKNMNFFFEIKVRSQMIAESVKYSKTFKKIDLILFCLKQENSFKRIGSSGRVTSYDTFRVFSCLSVFVSQLY